MRTSKFVTLSAVISAFTLNGCGSGGSATFDVDGHVFRVPNDHLEDGAIPWLPTSQSDGLRFIINPKDKPEAQMTVTIESTRNTCNPKTPPSSTQLASACSGKAEDRASSGGKELEKVYNNGDQTQWEYRTNGKGEVMASCFLLSDNSGGLCTFINRYDNLVYSLRFRDRDIDDLPMIQEKIVDLLSTWEVKGGK